MKCNICNKKLTKKDKYYKLCNKHQKEWGRNLKTLKIIWL